MSVEEKPLHEVILDIMYFKNTEKPATFTPEDIFWQMKDPDISERQIKEVLDWLVREKKAEQRFGKYQIDKYEFVDMANKYKEEDIVLNKTENTEKPKKVEVVKKISVSKPRPSKRTRRKPVKKRLPKEFWLLGVMFFILLGCVCYQLYITSAYSFSKIELEATSIHNPEELYIPIQSLDNQTGITKKQVENISYSFVKQNKTNKAVVNKLSDVDNRILQLQKELNKLNISYQQEKERTKILLISFLGLFVIVLILLLIIFRRKV